MENQNFKSTIYNTIKFFKFLPVLFAICIFTNFALAINKATYRLSGSCDAEQKTLIHKAVSAAVNRMQNERLWKKLYASTNYYNLSDDVLEISHINDSEKNRKGLLWNQLYYLSLPNSSNDSGPAFPDIRIRLTYAPNADWVGRAHLNLVKIFWNSSIKEWLQSGEFNIELNTAYLGNVEHNREFGDVDYWAGTIAHEMLHNLGHEHGDYGVDKNYNYYQVNVFDRIIASNGYESKAAQSQSMGGSDRVWIK